MERTLKAYAKVNIGLKVGEKRTDGYHDIDSFFLRVPLHDTIRVSSEEAAVASVSIKGNEGYMQDGGMDLMEKAARLYMKESGLVLSVSIAIEKDIPSQAGLGGGSSDAAAVFLALEEFHGAFGREKLLQVSKGIGADVPFFVSGLVLARVGGIGEVLEERDPSLLDYRWISFFRRESKGVSTKEAYAALDSEPRDRGGLPEIGGRLTRSSFPNDFERVGYFPVLPYLSSICGKDDYYSLSGSGDVAFVLSKEPVGTGDSSLIVSMPLAL